MSRAPTVSQLLKRAGLAKRSRSSRTNGSLRGATVHGRISNTPPGVLCQKTTSPKEDERGSRGEAEGDRGVDEKIAALERELQDASDSDDGSSISDGERVDVKATRKGSKSGLSGVTKLVSPLEAEKIEPLPAHLLPHPGCGVPKTKGQKTKRRKVTEAGPGPSAGLAKAVNELLASYEARSSEHVPFYCRVCKFQGESFEALEKHRREPFHLEAMKKERMLSKCDICKKEFTSPPQLQEHLKGKAHLAKVQDTMARQGKWVPDRGDWDATGASRSLKGRGGYGGRGRGYGRGDAWRGANGRGAGSRHDDRGRRYECYNGR